MTFTKEASPFGGTWYIGKEEFDEKCDIKASAKVYDEPSEVYGIDGGKISKLEIRIGNEIIANYDRGWDINVPEEARPLYESLLATFN